MIVKNIYEHNYKYDQTFEIVIKNNDLDLSITYDKNDNIIDIKSNLDIDFTEFAKQISFNTPIYLIKKKVKDFLKNKNLKLEKGYFYGFKNN